MRVLFFLCFLLSCVIVRADEEKRNAIIKVLITKELGSDLMLKTDESILKDSINEYPVDSVCLQQAVLQSNGLQNFIKNFTSLVFLFPPGTTAFEPEKLPSYKFDKYEYYATEMKKWLVQQKELVRLVDNYVPYKYKKVTEYYSTFNGNGNIVKYYGIYFFDEKDDLKKYFWFDEPKWNATMGLIVYAINHDYSFLEKVIKLLGFQFTESLMLYLMGDENIEFNRDELNQVLALREAQAKKESQSNSNSKQQEYSSIQNANIHTSINRDSSYEYTSRAIIFEGPKYIVKKDVCGATYSEKAMKQFTKYAINNNITGIDYMILLGQLTVLKRGQIVTMLDLGIFMSKVQLSNGAIVYTDTENLKKQ